jgi:aldehyde:ferredoxin oxidoreductase
MAGYDTLGSCIFAAYGFGAAPEAVPELLNARYGWDAGSDILQKLGRETLRMEREFNKRAGFTSAHDRLPEWMASEPLAPNNSIFDVSEADLDGIFDFEK